MTARIALVSARAARGLDEDMPPLRAAFANAGVDTEIADWDDAAIAWECFDLALLRSTWDYAERLGEFLAWVERTASRTLLLNPPAVVRWNSDKHYLGELARAGVPIVPSTFAEPGANARAVLGEFLAAERCAEFVVKPSVGAGSRDARRHTRSNAREAEEHIAGLLEARRSVLLQPYLERVDREGETALIFIGGPLSHAIRKGALLPAGAPATAGLFAPEQISPRVPEADEIALAERALGALPFGGLLYARFDLIRDDRGGPRLLEVELTEPSLFFTYAVNSAERFARAALARLPGAPARQGSANM
ncbi:MAG TPA: hypothetical protein VEH54_07185 [Steroidobacteraceae bacterium]|nr:hypothetical protein [Steroidobacteraceae bacterium]